MQCIAAADILGAPAASHIGLGRRTQRISSLASESAGLRRPTQRISSLASESAPSCEALQY